MGFEDECSSVEAFRRNERLKAASNVVANLGTATFAAGAARWFTIGFDPWVLVGIVGGTMIIWTGVYVLNGLEAEQADG